VCRPKQRKIAAILRTWDLGLEKLSALRKAKVVQAGHLRQRLFEAEYSNAQKLRRAREIFEAVSERARPDLPLLAVMQDIGIVRRTSSTAGLQCLTATRPHTRLSGPATL
jgi:type I restriction enzyme S subunit